MTNKVLKFKTRRGFGSVKLLQVRYTNYHDKTLRVEGYMVDIDTANASSESRIYPLTKQGLKDATVRFRREVVRELS